MAELQREGEPWEEGGKVFARYRETYLFRGQMASDVHEVSVVKGRKSPDDIKAALVVALKASCSAREVATPESKRVEIDIPDKLTV